MHCRQNHFGCLSDIAKTSDKIFAYLGIKPRPVTAGQPLLLQAERSQLWGAHSTAPERLLPAPEADQRPRSWELRAAHLRVGQSTCLHF